MKHAALFLLSVFLLLLVCFVFLFSTERGLLVIQKSVNRFGAGIVSIGQVEGRLLGDMRFKSVRLPGTGADIEVQQVDVSWRPADLFRAELAIAEVAVNGVKIVVQNGPATKPSGDVARQPANNLLAKGLPFSVQVDRLVVNRLAVVDSKGLELVQIDSLTAALSGNAERLSVGELDLQGPDIGLALHGNVEVQKNRQVDLLGNWRLAGFGFHPMAGTFSISGPFEGPHVEIGIHSPGSIRVKGDFVNLLTGPKWTARLEAKDVDLSTLIEYCPKIELAAVTGELTGDFGSYRGHVEADGAWDALTDKHLVSDIDGDGWGIDFQSLRIYGKDSSAEAMGGKISWRDIFSWQGIFLFKNFDPSVITRELQGKLNAELVSKGDVKEHGVVASFAISHLDGLLRDHKVSATGNVFLSETDVYTDGLTIRSGEVTGLAYIEKGSFSWAEQPSWSARVRLDNFDPSWLYAEFPGSIDGEFASEGKLGKNGPEGSLNIKRIGGTLRGNKLSGGGEITLTGDTLTTSGLVLKSGSSKLVVNGWAGDRLALDFSFVSPSIGALLPKSAGSISLRGNLQGNRNTPQLSAQLQGKGLSYQDYNFGRMQAEIKADFTGKGQLTGSLVGEEMSLAGVPLDKVGITLHGTPANHSVEVDGAGPLGVLAGKIHGRYRDTWQGALSHFQLTTLDYGIWRQQGESAITADSHGALLDAFCLSNGESAVCLGGDVQLEKETAWRMHGKLTSLPLQWLNRLKLLAVPVRGQLHADIKVAGNRHRLLSARVDSHVQASGALGKAKENEQVPFYFAGSVLSLQLADSLLQAHADIRMRNGSQVILNGDAPGAGSFATPLGSLPLHGSLELHNFDLSSITAFTNYGVEPSGRVNNSFTLAGTVGKPQIYGTVSIQDGGIDLPYQGITLTNVTVSIQAGEKSAKITAAATSGSGKLIADGTLQYGTKGIEGTLNIKGNDFLLVNLPEYFIRVNPDVQVTFSAANVQVRGTIDVPYGRITPEQMSGSISVSDDVVLIDDAAKEQIAGWPVRLQIKVRLGDDVRINGYGLAGRLGGQLMVNTNPDNSLAGRGELDLVGGTFTIYGRSLSIERGRMLFTGGPIDNPGVDVRAQVKVDDQNNRGLVYIVGVDISGLVQDLKYHLFSDPFMEDTEILSMMMVGHSLAGSTQSEGNVLEAAAIMLGVNGSSGFVKKLGSFLFLDDLHLEGSSSKENVSLVVGKRLTKDLYIGYDLNMFNQLGQFRVRYDLTRGFSVETRSSSESTGTDLIYSFER